ncbi:ABA4-like family protein [Streptomyces sp. KL118A]|uniref:ABA4-like family protein n=1 Tax=Streptomyces sp. KL118A TaxID=3045153 RepID=UPI00278BF60B|nr:ABA4-like family protein [Streptomyces sp. KL118A]
MTGFLFDLSFYLAAPVWLLMIFAPGWGPTARIAASPLTVVPVLAVYLALAVPVLPELWAAVSSPDIDGFRELTAHASAAGAIWAQVIAWDLLLGQWMFLEARRLGVHPLVTGPLLVLTILLSPFALLLFLALRAILTGRRRGAARAPISCRDRNTPDDPEVTSVTTAEHRKGSQS